MISCLCVILYVVFSVLSFFFQAEDGIRDLTVTGVQTCALPISPRRPARRAVRRPRRATADRRPGGGRAAADRRTPEAGGAHARAAARPERAGGAGVGRASGRGRG